MLACTVTDFPAASRKRSQGHDEDYIAVLASDSSSETHRVQQRKRARMHKAGSARDGAYSILGEDNEGIVMGQPGYDEESAATQYEIIRDAGFRHLEHADEDDRRATQRLQQKSLARSSNRAGNLNHAAENGILQSITCVNFMCHTKIHVELGPLLNFIVGENGSGKSAILTAITLCLGGKASSTNRGGSLKNFIKEGQVKAILVVKIKNLGQDAYQHDTYGDSIIVERYFTHKSSGFHVKSETGRIITNKKSEVDEIVEYYSLQVDNPLNVLSQDNARQFLNQASAKLKYKLFLQGVQLQQLDDDYRLTEEYATANQNKEADLERKFEHVRREYEKAKRDYNLYMQSADMRRECRALSSKVVWAQVIEAERKVKQNAQRIAEAEVKIAEAQRTIDQRTQELEVEDRGLAQAEEALKLVKQSKGPLGDRVAKATNELADARRGLEKIIKDERDARSHLMKAKENLDTHEKKIREEEQRLQELNGDAHASKARELEEVRAKSRKIELESEQEGRRIPGIREETETAKKKVHSLEALIFQKQADINATRNRIEELERGQGSLYDGYEPRVLDLLKSLETDAGFKQKPIGPIGAYIQVLQPVWSPILETAIGGTLNAFIVTSKCDQQRLSEMMKRKGIKRCPILIGNTRLLDISGSEPDNHFDTILRILKIEHPLIRSQLIINHRIEQNILVKEKRDAERIMLDSSGPPRNVVGCYHLFTQRGFGWGVRLVSNASRITSSPVRPPNQNQKPRLKSDSLQESQLHQDKLMHLKDDLDTLKREKQEWQHAIRRGEKEISDIQGKLDSNKQRIRETQVEMEDIQQVLDSFEGADGRLETLKEDLKKAQEDYDLDGDQYGTIRLRRQDQKSRVEDSDEKLRTEKRALKEFEAQLKKAENKVDRFIDSRKISLQKTNEAHEALFMSQHGKSKLEGRQKQLEEGVRDFTDRASKLCPQRAHIGEDETFEGLEQKFKSLRSTLKERERRRGMTDEQVIARATATKDEFEKLKTEMDLIRLTNKGLKSTLHKRLDRWRMFQRYISSNSRANFMYLLSERDFRGKLVLDHEQHLLEVQIEPDKTRKNAGTRNTKTLSGGEKSFSSICLLLAIWEAMGSPLRCLDEFDVFMDNVNRAISTQMLVSAARNSVSRQYILITPNAIEGRATLDKDVKITRLTDPRQQRLANP